MFPDAVVVLTRRDPVDVLRSLLPLLSYSLGVQNDWIDLEAFGKAWVARLKRIIEMQERDGTRLFPDAIEADFERIVGRDRVASRDGGGGSSGTMGLIREILVKAGLSVADKDLAPVKEFVENERIAKTGGSRTLFKYDLSVFGLDEEELVKTFST